MTKFRRIEEVEAIQWFPPGHKDHVEIDGVVSLPRHVVKGHTSWEEGWKPVTEVENTYMYWGGRLNCEEEPIYDFLSPGDWIVFNHNGWFETIWEWGPSLYGYEEVK